MEKEGHICAPKCVCYVVCRQKRTVVGSLKKRSYRSVETVLNQASRTYVHQIVKYSQFEKIRRGTRFPWLDFIEVTGFSILFSESLIRIYDPFANLTEQQMRTFSPIHQPYRGYYIHIVLVVVLTSPRRWKRLKNNYAKQTGYEQTS